MKDVGLLIILVLIVFIGVWLYRRHQENERKRKQLEDEQAIEREIARQKLFDFFKTKLDSIKTANQKFAKYIDTDTGYFANYQMTVWKNQQTKLMNEISGKPFEFIQLSSEEVVSIQTFTNYFKNTVNLRNDFNKLFIKEELIKYSTYFNNIEGRKLDTQQRTAVVTDEDNNIVIAGAGSGKTTTIIGKVNYIIDRYKINPNEILLISFTKKSASELAKRISVEGVEAKTFHKFGIDVICEVEQKQPSIFDENQFKSFIIKTFNELLKDKSYIQKVTEYFTNFLKQQKSQEEFENQGDYFQYLKDQNFKAYKQKEILVNGKKTFKMEIVKSIEECKIANFLLFNGIDYEYELPYEHETATKAYKQYKPDFTINPKGNKVYLEHFALNNKGLVPEWFADKENGETWEDATKKYNDGILWKRDLHKKHSTTLIESYSYEMFNDSLFNNLAIKLSLQGVVLKPKTPEEIWEIISTAAKDEVDSIISLFQTFITLMKSNNYTISDLTRKNNLTKDIFQKNRNNLFIEIVKPIFETYQNHLAERKEIDFSDMINKAASYLEKGIYKPKFSYIIIDEFQDISIGRYQLIKAIKTKNPTCKLFTVGDDWQSIYRFSGSDIALFKNFESYFGYTIKSKIETTYRFNQPLIDLSSTFILKNPNQAPKELKGANKTKTTNYKIVYSNSDNQNDTIALNQVMEELALNIESISEKKIFILGRYSFDIERLNNNNYLQLLVRELSDSGLIVKEYNYTKDKWKYLKKNEKIIIVYKAIINEENIKFDAEFLTVHKAKGLEAEIVIVINCNSGKHGFPSELSDDTVQNLLLSEADQFENGEERRLFYVAMTRAKENVFFIADSTYKSKFIAELEVDSGETSIKKCPNCITADLKLKSGTTNGKSWGFYSCTNYIYGCNFQEWV